MKNPKYSNAFINLSTALLIWLFGVLIFLPIANDIDINGYSKFLSLILLAAFSFFIFKSWKDICRFLETPTDILTNEWMQRRRIKNINKVKIMIRNTLKTTTLVIIYLLYSPLLSNIHPSINGIVLIIIIIYIFLIILKSINRFVTYN